jgi:hypothetical protein
MGRKHHATRPAGYGKITGDRDVTRVHPALAALITAATTGH